MSSISRSSLFRSNTNYPELQSFPTRRSSDLRTSTHRSDPSNARRKATLKHGGAGDWGSDGDFGGGDTVLDRKSTRLNSSHQIISYAVFCLKKKMQLAEFGQKNGGELSPTIMCHIRRTIVDVRHVLDLAQFVISIKHQLPRTTIFPYTTLFRSKNVDAPE